MRHLCVFALSLTLAPAPFLRAQDMPLSTFLVDGESWKPAAGPVPLLDPETVPDRLLRDGRAFVVVPRDERIKFPLGLMTSSETGTSVVKPLDIPGPGRPTAVALSPDKTTLFVGGADGAAVWAYKVEADGTPTGGEPYAPLRFRRGAKDPAVPVAALTVDRVGRIYALTPAGVQVFDPTGRLAGVLTVPAAGKPEHLGWEGEGRDVLAVWVGGKKFTRPLRAAGVK